MPSTHVLLISSSVLYSVCC